MARWDRVDWSDPISRDCSLNRGLVGWWMGAPNCFGGTRMQDLCNRNHGTLTNMDTATDWLNTDRGPALNFVKASTNYVQATNPVTSFPVTLTALIRPSTATGNHTYFGLSQVLGAASNPRRLLIYGTGGLFSLFFQDATTNFVFITDSVSFTAGTWYAVSCVFRSGDFELIVNGRSAVTSALTRTFATPSFVKFGVDSDVGNYASADVACGLIHTERVSLADCGRLHEQVRAGFPDMLRHARRRSIVAEAAAGGGGGFQAAWARRSNVLIHPGAC